MAVAKDLSICPACRASLRVRADEYRGRQFDCPSCDSALTAGNGTEMVLLTSSNNDTDCWRSLLVLACVTVGAGFVIWCVRLIPDTVAVQEAGPVLVARTAPDASAPRGKTDRDNDDVGRDEPAPMVSPDVVDGEPVDRPMVNDGVPQRPPVLGSVVKKGAEGLPPAWMNGLDDPSLREPKPPAYLSRPIFVPMAVWDFESEPLQPVLGGLMRNRSEVRLERALPSFRTSKATSVRRIVETLAEVAGVPLRTEAKWPTVDVVADYDESTIAEILEDVLAQAGLVSVVDEQGVLAVWSRGDDS